MKTESAHYLSGGRFSYGAALAACLALGFFVRLIPQLLAFPSPVGFDTVYYAVVMKSGVVWPDLSAFLASTWLLYAFIVPLYMAFPADPFLLLSVVAPVLYGLNVAGVYWFARKALDWSVKAGLLAGAFFALQLASLRISCDLLRNTLGLGLLLFTLPLILRADFKRGFALFALLSLLTVFSHEFAAVALLVVSFALIFWRLLKDRDLAMYKRRALAVVPALAIFLLGVHLRVFPVGGAVETNVISAGDSFSGSSGGLFFLVDYLSVRTSVDYYASYWALAFNVLLLFAVLYLPYLFLVLKGFFRDSILNVWTGLLLFGAFGCLFYPSSALLLWHRWMFMLVYPFTFYAVNGLGGLLRQFNGSHGTSFLMFPSKKAAAMVFLTVSLGVAYLFTPLLMGYANVTVPDFFILRLIFR